jgi:uncharacterized protein (DUF58 family)
LLVAGLALGNAILVYLSLVLFMFPVLSLAIPGPGSVKVTRVGDVATTLAGEAVSISLSPEVGGGAGIVTAADALPEHFQLAEGNNFHVYWHDGSSSLPGLSYKVRCTRREIYDPGPAQIECFQNSWVGHTAFDSKESLYWLIVRPEPVGIRKVRDPRLRSNMPMPSGAVCKMGVRTIDFLEIREYSHGDPYGAINWKATARLSAADNVKPFVNEYEKDGKKTVMTSMQGSG